MHLLQLAANETAVVTEEQDVRVRVAASGQADGASAMLRVRSPDGSAEQGQTLKVGETLVVSFQGLNKPAGEPEDSFTPYSDWTPEADDDDDDEGDVAELKDQVHVTLVHVYGGEAVLRFAVPDEWEVAVAIEEPAAKS